MDRTRSGPGPPETVVRTSRSVGLVGGVAVTRRAGPNAAPLPIAFAFTIVPAPKQEARALIVTPPSPPAASHRTGRRARSRARTPWLPDGRASRARKLLVGSASSRFEGVAWRADCARDQS